MKKFFQQIAFPLIGLAIVIAIWQGIIVFGHVPPYIAPRPAAAMSAIFSQWSQIWPLTWTTICETVYGFLAGAGVGFVLALAMAKVPVRLDKPFGVSRLMAGYAGFTELSPEVNPPDWITKPAITL